MFGTIKKMIKWVTRDGQTHYSGYEENADKLARAWEKSHPENRYEVVEIRDDRTSIVEVRNADPSMWDGIY